MPASRAEVRCCWGLVMRSRATGGVVLAWALLLAGCGPQMRIAPLEVHCVHQAQPGGWRIDTYLEVSVRHGGPASLHLSPADFRLRTTSATIAAELPDQQEPNRGSYGWSGPPEYAELPRLETQELPAGSTREGWLVFRDVLRVPRKSSNQMREALRDTLVQQLGALQPVLEYGPAAEPQTISLDGFTTMPDKLAFRKSRLAAGVQILDLPHGLCGFRLAALDAALRGSGLSNCGVVLLLHGPADPMVSEWFPAEDSMLGTLKLGLGQPAEVADDPGLAVGGTNWKPMTRPKPLPYLAPEAMATAAMMGRVGWHEAQAWYESGDLDTRAASTLLADTTQPEAAAAMMRLMQHETRPVMRGLACRAFTACEGGAVDGFRAEFEEALATVAADPDGDVCDAALEAAVYTKSSAAVVAQARQRLAASPESAAAMAVLIDAKDRDAVPLLLEQAARSPRSPAWDALREIMDESCLPALREFVKQGLGDGRSALLIYLSRYGDASDGDLLVSLWEPDAAAVDRHAVMNAMAHLGGDQAFAKLRSLALDQTKAAASLRYEACEALGYSDDPRAVAVLVQAAPGGHAWRCCDSLRKIGTPAAKAALQQLAAESDPEVRKHARRALGLQ